MNNSVVAHGQIREVRQADVLYHAAEIDFAHPDAVLLDDFIDTARNC